MKERKCKKLSEILYIWKQNEISMQLHNLKNAFPSIKILNTTKQNIYETEIKHVIFREKQYEGKKIFLRFSMLVIHPCFTPAHHELKQQTNYEIGNS